MAKKAKKKKQIMPKLSLLDKLIYWMIFLLIVLFCFGPLGLSIYLNPVIAFADEMVIASNEHASILWSSFTWFVSFVILFALWLKHYEDRCPIFGLRNFKYGPPAFPKVYPLFMKSKPYVWVSENEKKARRRLIVVLVILVLISWIPYPWSLYGRDSLFSDGSIGQYNMFNTKVREFHSGEIDRVEFGTYYHAGTKFGNGKFSVCVSLSTETGREYVFQSKDFRDAFDGEPCNWLTAMLHLKERYIPEIVQYTGVDKLHHVVQYHKMSEEETKILYQLFDLA